MLTIDIGNTRVKWALWERGRITRSGSAHLSKQEPATAFETWNTLPRQDHVIAACVAGERVERALDEWTRSHWSVQTEFLRSTAQLNGVHNAYPDPAQYGVDRWAALLGAHALYDVPVCIIDTGTAITVDLLDAEGIHRGGRILPGLQMMREALVRCTDGINRAEGEAPVFANNTADAVSSGTLRMLQAALVEICRSAGERLGDEMKIIITGGMSEQIMSLPELPELLHEPDLVLKGLHAVVTNRPAEG